MEHSNWPNEAQRIILLKKIILSYLEQYMLYHIEQDINSHVSLKNLIEEHNLRCLFRVLSKALILNIEQFIKSRKWMNEESASSIKNITITSINIIPEDQEIQASIDSDHEVYELKQVSSDSLDLFKSIVIPEGESNLGEGCVHDGNELSTDPRNYSYFTNGDSEYIPGLILGKMNFISLTLASIKKILEIAKKPAPSRNT